MDRFKQRLEGIGGYLSSGLAIRHAQTLKLGHRRRVDPNP